MPDSTGSRNFAACNHLRSYKYYADSIINPTGFAGFSCSSYSVFAAVSSLLLPCRFHLTFSFLSLITGDLAVRMPNSHLALCCASGPWFEFVPDSFYRHDSLWWCHSLTSCGCISDILDWIMPMHFSNRKASKHYRDLEQWACNVLLNISVNFSVSNKCWTCWRGWDPKQTHKMLVCSYLKATSGGSWWTWRVCLNVDL